MSRQSRIKEYSNPTRSANWQGAGRDQENIDRWSERASENSKCAPRASSEMKLHSTGKAVDVRDTSAGRHSRHADARMKAMEDTNIAGDSDYLPGLRRNA